MSERVNFVTFSLVNKYNSALQVTINLQKIN